jgi:hypothetical protein
MHKNFQYFQVLAGPSRGAGAGGRLTRAPRAPRQSKFVFLHNIAQFALHAPHLNKHNASLADLHGHNDSTVNLTSITVGTLESGAGPRGHGSWAPSSEETTQNVL